MMTGNRKTFPWIVSAFVLGISACNFPGVGISVPKLDEIAITVEGTMEVLDLTNTSTSVPEPTVIPLPINSPTLESSSKLISTPTPTLEPTSSPGVLRVAFIDENGNIILWSETQQDLVPLTTGGRVADLRLSPDGKIVVFTRMFDFTSLELWAINTDGTDERLLVSVR